MATKILRCSPAVVALIGDRKIFNPPSFHKRSKASFLIQEPDGSTVPLLWLVAEKVFGAWDPKIGFPYWKDMDCCNASEDNVAFSRYRLEPKARVSKYGVLAGTPEYYRVYNKDPHNKVKRQTYMRERYKRMRQDQEAYKQMQQANAHSPSTEPLRTWGPLEELVLPTKQEDAPGLDPTGSNLVEK